MAKKKAAKKTAKKKAAKPKAKAPAAKPVARKKESNKFLIWAIVVVVIVVLIFLIRGVKQAEVEPEAEVEAPVVEAPVVEAPEVEEVEDEVPETAPGEDFVEEGDLESGDYAQQSLIGNPQYGEAALAKDLTPSPEKFSNFECALDDETGMRYISLKVTNTNSDVAFMISEAGIQKGYNTYFMIKSMVDDAPGCGVEELAPGEVTICDGVGLDNPRFTLTEGINRLTIQSPNDEGKTRAEAVIVDCP